MKTIGWILIVAGILLMITGGVSLSFEGICAALAPIIGGIICLFRASKKTSE